MTKKVYLLDTNVYLTNYNAFYSYGKSDIYLPLKVIQELDKHKTRTDIVGFNARSAIRVLDELRSKGDLRSGISLGRGKGKLFAYEPHSTCTLPFGLDSNTPDNQILLVAIELAKDLAANGRNLILVTRDVHMRVASDALGLKVENYEPQQAVGSRDELYTGTTEMLVDDEFVELFYKEKEVFLTSQESASLRPNEYLVLRSNNAENKTALARFVAKDQPLRKVKQYKAKTNVFGLETKNKEQTFAMDLLLDKTIPLVSLVGVAGSGKTLLAIAAGLKHVMEAKEYNKLIVSRPIQPMGKDIGFLPGPQPLTSKILTPKGWTTMGEVKVGSKVMSVDGKPTEVLGVFPKGKKDVYQITTSDGRKTKCCADHLWYTETKENRKRKKPGSVKTTSEIMETFLTNKGKPNHYLPRHEPIEYDTAINLPIPPYTLGALLGDGSIANGVAISNVDLDIIAKVREEAPAIGCTISKVPDTITYNFSNEVPLFNNKTSKRVQVENINNKKVLEFSSVGKAAQALNINSRTIAARCRRGSIVGEWGYKFLPSKVRWQNKAKEAIYSLGLSGTYSDTKFIPDIYKYRTSAKERIELLRGLMDTDGTIKKNGEATFCTTSLQLAKDVVEIVQSLGGSAKIRSRNRIGKSSILNGRTFTTRKKSYEFNICLPNETNPFHLERKVKHYSSRYMHGIKITNIEKVGAEEVQCIQVENPSSLYITDDYIVTHNTVSEKVMPWLAPIQDNLQNLIGDKAMLQDYMDRGIIELEALTYIRGRSIANAYMIVDEAQNLTAHELKTIITRVGEGTKIVLTGDLSQIDNIYITETSSGLTNVVEKFKDSSLSGHVLMRKGERSALATQATELLQ